MPLATYQMSMLIYMKLPVNSRSGKLLKSDFPLVGIVPLRSDAPPERNLCLAVPIHPTRRSLRACPHHRNAATQPDERANGALR
jgi:hypothetical protein